MLKMWIFKYTLIRHFNLWFSSTMCLLSWPGRPRVWFCRRFLPVKRELFLPTVAKCSLVGSRLIVWFGAFWQMCLFALMLRLKLTHMCTLNMKLESVMFLNYLKLPGFMHYVVWSSCKSQLKKTPSIQNCITISF